MACRFWQISVWYLGTSLGVICFNHIGTARDDYDYMLPLHYILHYITLLYTTLHYFTLHYFTFRYVTLHSFTLHYTTLHYITLHYIVAQQLLHLLGVDCQPSLTAILSGKEL